ncbi:MAG: hypothetical protein ACPGQL_00465 [Thermoplasmatota archaeon]
MGTLVLVCSSNFSGSTMLDLMLGSHPRAFSVGEVQAWYRPEQEHHLRIVCPCGQRPCPAWEQLRDLPARHLHRDVLAKMDKDVVVDSSKDPSWVHDAARWAARDGLDVRHVVIWKDPVALAHSYWKRGSPLALWRKHQLDYYERLRQLRVPLVGVRVEELAADPVATLRRLSEALDIPFEAGQERFWDGDLHPLFGNLRTRHQVEAGASTIRREERFEPGFDAVRPEVERMLAEDERLRSVVTWLESLGLAHGASTRDAAATGPGRRVMPWWYYRNAVWKAVRRVMLRPPWRPGRANGSA